MIDPTTATREDEEIRRRQRGRAIVMAVLLGLLRDPRLRDHHRQDDRQPVTASSRPPIRAATRRARGDHGAARAGDGRPRLRQRAALPDVLPGDRLQRHHPARGDRRGAGRRSPGKERLGPLRRQRLADPAVALRARAQTPRS